MIVSWNWLAEYVALPGSSDGATPDAAAIDEATERLTMSGLNLEGTEPVLEGQDTAIDLEVTSNRPDCLGHIGVARELAVLATGGEICTPEITLDEDESAHAQDLITVDINCPDDCSHYTARVVRGVRVGPSPAWLTDRLRAVGIQPVNNIVDVTNYVMFECGQPLHAFDYAKVGGQHIIVRHAGPGETLEAINHKTYELAGDMVIADANQPMALAGVMGGAESEITADTTDIIVESARFDPVAVRTTARRHVLFSDASYRFERNVDEQGLDWASRRCCELIVQVAGGQVAAGVAKAGKFAAWSPEPLALRASQVRRILGIDIAAQRQTEILSALGCEVDAASPDVLHVKAPSWRADLTREIDLIEEVARIEGYDKIPGDAMVPIAVQLPGADQVATERAIDVLVAAGFHEAMTLAFVSEGSLEYFRPHPELPPIKTTHSSRRRENLLRPSLVPDLLQVRRENERMGQADAEIFEIARAFHRAEPSDPTAQPRMIAGVCSRSFRELRGILETLAQRCCGDVPVTVVPSDITQFANGRGAELILGEQPWGWMGQLHDDVVEALDLSTVPLVFEVRLAPLAQQLIALRTAADAAIYPAVTRDINFVLDEATPYAELESVVREAGGRLLENVTFVDEYRGEKIDAGRKSYVIALTYRDETKTLTRSEVDAIQDDVIATVKERLGATQR